MVRPVGCRTKHLTEQERFRVRVLYYDACMTKRRIEEITGYSEGQIRTAISAKSAQVGVRTGRPKRGSSSKQQEQSGQSTPSEANENEQPSGPIQPPGNQQLVATNTFLTGSAMDRSIHEQQIQSSPKPVVAPTEQDSQLHGLEQRPVGDLNASRENPALSQAPSDGTPNDPDRGVPLSYSSNATAGSSTGLNIENSAPSS